MAQATAATPIAVLPAPGFAARQWKGLTRFFRTQPLGVLGLAIIVIVVLAAVFADVIATADPTSTSVDILESPSGDHVFGTTRQGKDVYSRVVHGARVSLEVGLATVLISIVLSCLPPADDPNPRLAVIKVVGSSLMMVAIGAGLYFVGRYRRRTPVG